MVNSKFFNKGISTPLGILIIILCAFIAGGIFAWQYYETIEVKVPEVKAPEEKLEKEEVKIPEDKRILEIINEILPDNLDKTSAKYSVNDLDEDRRPEIIITAVQFIPDPYFPKVQEGYFIVVTIIDGEGSYKKIGDLKHEADFRGAPEVKNLQDIDSNGQKEIFLDLKYGGAASFCEGILDLDFSNQNLDWVKFRSEKGDTQDAIFCLAASAMHHNTYIIEDLDRDGKKEIVEVYTWGELPQKPEEELGWRCEAKAYEWDGSLFSYNEELSKMMLPKLGPECRAE